METHTFYDRTGANRRVAEICIETGDLTITMENVLYTTITWDKKEPVKDADGVTMIMEEAMYTNVPWDDNDTIKAIDPDGGPFICKGFTIDEWVVKEIISYTEEGEEEEKTVVVKGKAYRV